MTIRATKCKNYRNRGSASRVRRRNTQFCSDIASPNVAGRSRRVVRGVYRVDRVAKQKQCRSATKSGAAHMQVQVRPRRPLKGRQSGCVIIVPSTRSGPGDGSHGLRNAFLQTCMRGSYRKVPRASVTVGAKTANNPEASEDKPEGKDEKKKLKWKPPVAELQFKTPS